MDHSGILFALFYVFVAAQIGAEVAQRFKLPSVVGEIAAGIIVGPSILGLVSVAPTIAGHANGTAEPLLMLAEVGAVLLLFSVGLETRLGDLRKVGSSAFQVGTIGLIIPFILGALWAHFSGHDTPRSLFIAAAFVATSAGITARVLSELGVLSRVESRVILGAAVIDDILAMLLLGVVGSLGKAGGVSIGNLIFSLVAALLVCRHRRGWRRAFHAQAVGGFGRADFAALAADSVAGGVSGLCGAGLQNRVWRRSSVRFWRAWRWPKRHIASASRKAHSGHHGVHHAIFFRGYRYANRTQPTGVVGRRGHADFHHFSGGAGQNRRRWLWRARVGLQERDDRRRRYGAARRSRHYRGDIGIAARRF